jgi:hypothetical protein
MIFLVLVSLLWMILDWHFINAFTSEIIQDISPAFFNWYNLNIHPNYFKYDTYFVAVFVIELVIRWIGAIFNKTYYKWWFYPFIHWYDTLGCIPLGSFRVLRLVRIYSMTIRLDKKGFINIKQTGLYRLIKRNTDILVEEVSDRVVDNVLLGVQEEIYMESGSVERIIKDVIQPKQEDLVRWIAIKIQETNHAFYAQFNDNIKDYLIANIEKSIEENEEIKKIDKIPLLGKQITQTLQKSISEVTYQIIENTMKDLAEYNREEEINEIVDIVFESMLADNKGNKNLNMTVKDIVSESLDIVREQVNKKQWKVMEEI